MATNIATATTHKASPLRAPRNLRAVRQSANSVELYWNWPDGSPNLGVNGFQAQERESDETWAAATAAIDG